MRTVDTDRHPTHVIKIPSLGKRLSNDLMFANANAFIQRSLIEGPENNTMFTYKQVLGSKQEVYTFGTTSAKRGQKLSSKPTKKRQHQLRRRQSNELERWSCSVEILIHSHQQGLDSEYERCFDWPNICKTDQSIENTQLNFEEN
jgi:hypothetical protein